MSTRIDLSIAIVAFDSDRALLEATLRSLAQACQLVRERHEARIRLFLLDNGAATAPLGALPLEDNQRAIFDTIECRPMERNLGYGAAHNRALEFGCGEYHLVLNPDVELDPRSLLTALEYLEQHPAAVGVVPDGRAEDGTPLYLAKAEPSVLVLLLRALLPGARLPRMDEYELRALCSAAQPAAVPLASGCCMLLRGASFSAVGGFDPRYFLYFEDFDLSRRLRRLGALVWLPDMRIVHHGGMAARKGARHIGSFCRSAWRYFSIWGWRWL